MFKITVEGMSRITILSQDGVPIARFYAGRFDGELLALIERKLNRPDATPTRGFSFAGNINE